MTAQNSQALVPTLIAEANKKVFAEAVSIFAGVLLLSLLAQVAVPLPWTPVPITGQTLGVSLVALSWGRSRALSILSMYLGLGYLGLPIFSLGTSGIVLGPTSGYLLGMALSSFAVGTLADKGYTKTFLSSTIATFIGSAIVYLCGLFVLALFVPKNMLLISGFYPFIAGDILKNILAAVISWKCKKFIK